MAPVRYRNPFILWPARGHRDDLLNLCLAKGGRRPGALGIGKQCFDLPTIFFLAHRPGLVLGFQSVKLCLPALPTITPATHSTTSNAVFVRHLGDIARLGVIQNEIASLHDTVRTGTSTHQAGD